MNPTTNDPTETLVHLTRLSQKPGVVATLVLSSTTGAIIRSSGLLTDDNSATDINNEDEVVSPERRRVNMTGDLRSAREVATAVFNLFKNAGTLVEQMMELDKDGEGGDEVRLLRLRLKRKEVVVVPGMSREVAVRGGRYCG